MESVTSRNETMIIAPRRATEVRKIISKDKITYTDTRISAEINNDGEISFPSKGGTVKMIIAMVEIIERAANFFLSVLFLTWLPRDARN